MLSENPIRVLFLCTGNSARSVMAESILNSIGGAGFVARSAGSHPTGTVNPAALSKLTACGHVTGGLRSKSWEEFSAPGAPAFDCVITVCDAAAGESCPVWAGSPVSAHWGIADPAAVRGDDAAIRQAFDEAYEGLVCRIGALVRLPLASMDAAARQAALDAIGRDRR